MAHGTSGLIVDCVQSEKKHAESVPVLLIFSFQSANKETYTQKNNLLNEQKKKIQKVFPHNVNMKILQEIVLLCEINVDMLS